MKKLLKVISAITMGAIMFMPSTTFAADNGVNLISSQ